jgi:hypothetical protein
MDNLSQKPVVRKGFKNMIVLGLGLAVIVGFTPVTALAGFQNPVKQTRQFNGQSQDSYLMGVSAGESIIMARGGNRSGGGGGMGQRNGGDSERGYKYGPGDGTGTGERPGDGTGYGAKKKGTGTGECDGTGPKGKGRGNRTN